MTLLKRFGDRINEAIKYKCVHFTKKLTAYSCKIQLNHQK